MHASHAPEYANMRRLILILTIAAPIPIVIMCFFSVMPLTRLITVSPILVTFATIAVLAAIWPSWLNQPKVCATCKTLRNSADRHLERCPNCDADWTSPAAFTRPHLLQTPKRSVITLAAFALLFFLPNWTLQNHVGHRAVVMFSSDVLIDAMVRGDYTDRELLGAAWEELQRRELSDTQLTTLAEGLAAAPGRYPFRGGTLHWTEKSGWLTELVETRRLPREVVLSYWRSRYPLDFQIAAPGHVKLGTEIGVQACCAWPGRKIRSSAGHNQSLAFFVGGFTIDGQDGPLGRQSQALGFFDLNCSETAADDNTGDVPSAMFRADRPGSIKVRFNCWVVLSTEWLVSKDIVWQDDGTPRLPDDAIWIEQIEAEHVVGVGDSG